MGSERGSASGYFIALCGGMKGEKEWLNFVYIAEGR